MPAFSRGGTRDWSRDGCCSDRLLPVSIESRLLKQRRNVLVYLPPGYRRSRRRYPILYLLHGACGSELDWVFQGRVHQTLDGMIAAGRIAPMVVAMPGDGLYGAGTFYVDWYDGTGPFERHFLREVMPTVEQAVRVRTDRGSRAVAGLSMGGYGALTLSLRHPDLFCAAASLSGMTMPIHPAIWGAHARRLFGPLRGRSLRYRLQRDPRHLVTLPRTRAVALHISCGQSDHLFGLNRKLHRLLERIGRPHEYREPPGGHDWAFWRRHVADAIEFIDRQWKADTQAGRGQR